MATQSELQSTDFSATLTSGGRTHTYYSLDKAAKLYPGLERLPFSLKVLLENILRHMDGSTVKEEDLKSFSDWLKNGKNPREIAYRPARVLMQDFTGVPAIVDLAAMRDALLALGSDPQLINPISPVDLVIDHSVMVDAHAHKMAFERNVAMEFRRNAERYNFLRWGQDSFANFRVVPPGTGICHQVNLEYLARVVWQKDEDGQSIVYPDTLVGTDSHTTMVNGLGVLGWGVGGIEAEAAMLGQPVSMLLPEVVGVRFIGTLKEGMTATDLVLAVTEVLRKKGVVEKFVEYFGPGLAQLSLADRATIANMAPEYGATCGIFPVDEATLEYLHLTGREADQIKLVKDYCQAQNMFGDNDQVIYTEIVEIDLSKVEPSLAGPKRPQDRIALSQVAQKTRETIGERAPVSFKKDDETALQNADVVIAAITSCTNTSNPAVMVAAGLVARKARERGLETKPWVKTSLAPGSQVVSDYLKNAKLDEDLDALGFHLVGYGCTTCIGNSGPLDEEIKKRIDDEDLFVAAVLSGNRNFEGRVHPMTKANFLASPPLVVAYALAGSVLIDFSSDPLGHDRDGQAVMLKDIWPSKQEIEGVLKEHVTSEIFKHRYSDVFTGPKQWQEVEVAGGELYRWTKGSTYVQKPPYFEGMSPTAEPVKDVKGARMLLMLGDSITTDHISPAGSFAAQSPAGNFLSEHQVSPAQFNSYGSRRGNHEVMMRGTFANIRIRNELVSGSEGGVTRHEGKQTSVYDAAMKYAAQNIPVIVIGGKEYGTGSSRDWAAKGTRLLGVRAVIVESFERIHRSNLVGMGVLPLEFLPGTTRKTLKLTGSESFDILGIEKGLEPRKNLSLVVHRSDGAKDVVPLLCRIDTENEMQYYLNGGVLHYVLRKFVA